MALISENVFPTRPQELGKIKIGGRGEKRQGRGGEFYIPRKDDFFTVTTRERDGKEGDFKRDERIHEVVGERPTELPGILMFPEIEQNFHSEFAVYQGKGARGKVLTCDGETATNLQTNQMGECKLTNGGDCKCKPYIRLALQLWASDETLGFHIFRSHSWETARNIQSALKQIHGMFGTLYHAPVKLKAYHSEDHYVDEQGNPKTGTSLKVGLTLAMGLAEAAQHMADANRRLESAKAQVHQLAAGVREDLEAREQEEEVEVAQEFAPPPEAEAAKEGIEAQLLGGDGEVQDVEVVEPEPEPEEGPGDPEAKQPDDEEDPFGADDLPELPQDEGF